MQVARKRNPQLVFILLELNSTSKLGCPLKIRRGSSRLPVSWHTRSDPHIVHTLPARGGTDKSSGKTVLLCNQHNPIYQWGSVVECNPNSYRCGVGNELLALSPDSPLPHSEMYQNHCKLHDICNTVIYIYRDFTSHNSISTTVWYAFCADYHEVGISHGHRSEYQLTRQQ